MIYEFYFFDGTYDHTHSFDAANIREAKKLLISTSPYPLKYLKHHYRVTDSRGRLQFRLFADSSVLSTLINEVQE